MQGGTEVFQSFPKGINSTQKSSQRNEFSADDTDLAQFTLIMIYMKNSYLYTRYLYPQILISRGDRGEKSAKNR